MIDFLRKLAKITTLGVLTVALIVASFFVGGKFSDSSQPDGKTSLITGVPFAYADAPTPTPTVSAGSGGSSGSSSSSSSCSCSSSGSD